MKVIDTLKIAFEQHRNHLSGYGIDLICKLVYTLILVRSVNLMRIAASFPGQAKVDSHYRRLQRFFAQTVHSDFFAPLILERVAQPGQEVILSLDRTHWKLGKTDQNILCLGVVYQGVSVPLVTTGLGKAGNSDTQTRISLLKRALPYLKPYRCCLLADREFVGKKWLQFLMKQDNFTFVIRHKSNNKVKQKGKLEQQMDRLSPRQKRGTTKTYPNIQLYNSLCLNLVSHQPNKGERLFLITNREDLDQVRKFYKKRWTIETAFGFLKSRGFELEQTHLTHPKRLELLILVLALCLLWGLLVGYQQQLKNPIPIKKHGRKAISIFRVGLDYLQHCLQNLKYRFKEAIRCCQLLVSCT